MTALHPTPAGRTPRPDRSAAPKAADRRPTLPSRPGTQTVVDTWLDGGSVLATLHLPGGGADTGVVICPPLGYEYAVAYRTLRHLADRIALSGVAAVRYDHPGFGDSTVPLADDSLERGAAIAADALRTAGVERIVYLGLGSGALVASAAAASDVCASGLVLWDASPSGRQWLRRQKSLYTIEMGETAEPTPDGVVEIAGAEFPTSFADHVSSLDYAPETASRMPVLVALREGPTGTVPKSLRSATDLIDTVDVPGHEDSLDLSSILATIPATSVRVVVDWLAEHFAGSTSPLTAPVAVDEALFRAADADLSEKIVRVGPNRLFAIETRPRGADSSIPAVVLHNGSAEHRTGATRHQVVLARELAARGMRVLRVDRRGTGETGTVTPGEPSLLFTQAWVEDGDASLDYLDLPREKVGVVGMCVGGWLGLVASPEKTKFIASLAMNDHRVRPSEPRELAAGVLADAPPVGPRWVDRAVAYAKEHLPYRALNALAARGYVQFAEPNLRRALASGTDVLLFNGAKDARVFAAHGGATAVKRLADTPGHLEVVERATGDHALYSPGIRAEAIERSIDLAVRSFGLDDRR
ncbi:hypothetical protein [Frondihabitans cladoniiphilus]|uniref:Uncharacterized protein n=1 Tax=Frondihabitans cladoniiphilus TaxID=715785 RepID=A0ABP8W2S7_9MICO